MAISIDDVHFTRTDKTCHNNFDHNQSLSPGVDCQGALEAARRFTDDQVLHTGYRLVLVIVNIVIIVIVIVLVIITIAIVVIIILTSLTLLIIIILLLLRFLSDPTISAQQRDKFLCPDNRELFNVKTDQEVTITIITVMANCQFKSPSSSYIPPKTIFFFR